MEYLLLALAAGAMGVGWWWLGRRRKQLLGDSDDPSSLIPREPGPPEVFTRESLVGRQRAFDPSAWDNTPGEGGRAPSEPSDPDELPARFDRSYLERTSRRPAAPGAATGEGGQGDLPADVAPAASTTDQPAQTGPQPAVPEQPTGQAAPIEGPAAQAADAPTTDPSPTSQDAPPVPPAPPVLTPPERSPAAADDDEPTYFDRDFLERTAREREQRHRQLTDPDL